MEVSSRHHGFSSPDDFRRQAADLFHRLEVGKETSSFLGFLEKIRLLPLGRPGVCALARLTFEKLSSHDTLTLRRVQKPKSPRIVIPNVFRGHDPMGIRQFLRVAKDPAHLQKLLLLEAGFVVAGNFTISTLGRLYEALPVPTHSPLLIRICNWRGCSVRWPAEMLLDGGEVIAPHSGKQSKGAKRKRSRIRAVIRAFRTAGRNSSCGGGPKSGADFEFPDLEGLSADESETYVIIREIVRTRQKTRLPRRDSSFANYLHQAVDLIEAEQKGFKLGSTPPRRQAHRLINEARERLKLPTPSTSVISAPVEVKIRLNLVPIRFIEDLVYTDLPAATETREALARLLVIISLATGRRASDFSGLTLAHFSAVLHFTDLTIPHTKVATVTSLPLPLHRLIPQPIRPYVARVIEQLALRYEKGTTIYEILSGGSGRATDGKDKITAKISAAEAESLDNEVSRSHTHRYAFGAWAPVAATLAWTPELRDDPRIRPWVEGSHFFCPHMLEEWRKLTGSAASDPFDAVSRILGHTSTSELQRVYCVSWTILLEIAVIKAAAALGISMH